MADQLPNPSKPTLYIGLFLLAVLAIWSLVYFIVESVRMMQGLNALSGSFYFNKGVFYLLGVVLGLSVLIFAIVRESVLRKTLTKKIASVCTRVGIASVVVMIVLPQAVGYGVEGYLVDLHYQICNEASHQWLHSRTIVFTRDQDICRRITRQQ